MTSYVVFRIVLAVIVGAVAYILDRRMGARLYAWWYRMTHRNPLPEGVTQGYICGQPAKIRGTVAAVLSTMITVLCVAIADVNALVELLMWLVGIPSTFAGFLLGPLGDRLWGRRDTMFDAVDKWEHGEVDLSDELKKKTGSLRERLSGWFRRPETRAPTPPSAERQKPQAIGPPKETLPPQPTQDPEELVNQFIKPRTQKDRDGN